MLSALNQVSVLDLGLIMRPMFGQMVNVGFGPAGILGLCIAGAGAGLYLLRSMRPELARDYDIFFSAIGLLCGGILFFNGWRLDPILMFGQVLMAGSAVFFAFESIRLRSITTDQARRSGGRSPIVDDERSYPVDQVYRAELDEIEPFMDDRPPVRRIRGSRDQDDQAAYNERYSAYGRDRDPGVSYGSRSSRRSSSRRSSRPSRSDSYGYGTESAYGSDPAYGSDTYGSDTSYGGWGGGTDSTTDSTNSSAYGSSYDSEYSSRRSVSRDESSVDNPRRPSPRPRPSARRDSYYNDEPPAARSQRSRYDASREEPASPRSNGDDYVDYKPIRNYSEGSSSTYGSRRPATDYDDEWGAS